MVNKKHISNKQTLEKVACKKTNPLKFDDGLACKSETAGRGETSFENSDFFRLHVYFKDFGAVASGCIFFQRFYQPGCLIGIPSLFESIPFGGEHFLIWMVVSTHLKKYESKWVHLPQREVNTKNINKPPPSNITPVIPFFRSRFLHGGILCC